MRHEPCEEPRSEPNGSGSNPSASAPRWASAWSAALPISPSPITAMSQLRTGSACRAPAAAADIFQDLAGGVVAGRPGDAAARVRAGAALVEAGDRGAVVA